MAKTKSQKVEMLSSYKAKLSDAFGVIVLTQSGLKPSDVSEFKSRLEGAGASYQVVKNTVFSIALKELGLAELDALKLGPSSIVYTTEDVASAAKVVAEFVKQSKEKIKVKAGILDGKELSIAQVNELSEMPTKQQSIGMIAGILQQSISGIANVMQDSVRSVAIIIDLAYKDK